jgi:signal-transduction protein with cAMP-binding, CBS, and nucleotidyltransferase domain
MALWGLEKFELFKGLNPGEIQAIGKIVNKVMYNKDDIITDEKNKSRDVFVLVNGRVDIVSLNGIPLYRISNGETFGELAIVPSLKRTAIAAAREDSWVLIINMNHLESFGAENPDTFRKISTNLVNSLGVKLARANKLIELLKTELAKSLKK